MAASEEIILIALQLKPHLVTIVPEKREELTTEGGLDIYNHKKRFKDLTQRFHDNGIKVSYFLEASEEQLYTAAEIQADIIELHTGHYADASNANIRQHSLEMLIKSVLSMLFLNSFACVYVISFLFLYFLHELPIFIVGVLLIIKEFSPIATNCVFTAESSVATAEPAPIMEKIPIDILNNVSIVLSVLERTDSNACTMLSRIFINYDS